jgi:AbrB family looped-hinge helix DNA binding protein
MLPAHGFRKNAIRANFLPTHHRLTTGMIMSETATLSTKFQISIPKAVRAARQWKAGQEFAFIPKGAGVMLVPIPKASELAGIAKGAKTTDYRDRKDRF